MKKLALVLAFLATPAFAQHEHHSTTQPGALGPQPMSREASGTAWQPDAAPMSGWHSRQGFWTFMAHGYLDVIWDDQGGPRGDEALFVPGMVALMGHGPFGPGTAGLKLMLSPDPLMGRDGYPLLFQTGETADGQTELVDRQHPHDFFMELAGSYSLRVGDEGSVFVYGGLPGEPALGPPAFMHRASGITIPEAPLTHHWLDSTHITFGVATLGATWGEWKVETSAFNGREPDQNRWNIELRGVDSYSGRVSWNAGTAWSMQLSHGYLGGPEQLHPDEGVHRSTASLSHTLAQGHEAHWSTTFAVGVNRHGEDSVPGYVLESTRQFSGPLALFARGEYIRSDHLIESGPLAGEEFGVAKLTGGFAYRVADVGPLRFSAGALASVYRYAESLETEYGERPVSGMVFVRTALR
ncbi:MAG TPA: hypothetical protein VM240_01535 [Verrucomicrobiae bacterium]|nr:hypothetical protein [Verrucomicrobiae bacterium]